MFQLHVCVTLDPQGEPDVLEVSENNWCDRGAFPVFPTCSAGAQQISAPKKHPHWPCPSQRLHDTDMKIEIAAEDSAPCCRGGGRGGGGGTTHALYTSR